MASRAVPETTPSWPSVDTALASCQPDTATPMPPWMITGSWFPMSPMVGAARGRGIHRGSGEAVCNRRAADWGDEMYRERSPK